MKVTNEFLIPFVGLKLGKHKFEYQIDKKFFEHFEYDEFENANIKVNVVLDKKSTMLEVSFKHFGTINVPCDLTNENFDLSIKGDLNLIVRFGEEYNDDNEDLLILPFAEFQLDVSQYIYEMIVLSIPLKKVSPVINDDSLKSVSLLKLDKINIKEQKIIKEENTDPRWDTLKKLLTDK